MGVLLRDLEVFISNITSITTHALLSSLEEAAKNHLWKLHEKDRIPEYFSAVESARCTYISGKKT
jgi:hypothetical protein